MRSTGSPSDDGYSEKKRVSVSRGKKVELEKFLLEWFHQCRSDSVHISDDLVTEQAKKISSRATYK